MKTESSATPEPTTEAPAARPAEPAVVADTATAEPASEPAATDEPVAPEEPTASTEEPAASTEVVAAKPAEEPAAEEPVAAPASDAPQGTTFKGRVVVKGTPPVISPIKPTGNDPFCLALGQIPNDEVVIGEGNGLANVFVWVRKVPSGVEVPEPPAEPAVLDQKDCRFIPPALVVEVGQQLLLKNADATSHNTNMSGIKNSFNTGVSPNNRTGILVELKSAEGFPVPVACNVHSWMQSRVLVTDNPWHAVTDKDGYFEINNLPAGVELEFRLQHNKGYVERSLELTFEEDEVKEQTFEMDAAQLSK